MAGSALILLLLAPLAGLRLVTEGEASVGRGGIGSLGIGPLPLDLLEIGLSDESPAPIRIAQNESHESDHHRNDRKGDHDVDGHSHGHDDSEEKDSEYSRAYELYGNGSYAEAAEAFAAAADSGQRVATSY